MVVVANLKVVVTVETEVVLIGSSSCSKYFLISMIVLTMLVIMLRC